MDIEITTHRRGLLERIMAKSGDLASGIKTALTNLQQVTVGGELAYPFINGGGETAFVEAFVVMGDAVKNGNAVTIPDFTPTGEREFDIACHNCGNKNGNKCNIDICRGEFVFPAP